MREVATILFFIGSFILSNVVFAQEVGLEGRKVVIVVAPKDFRDEEAIVPLEFFKEKKAEVIIASLTKGTAKGMLGATLKVDKTIDEIDPKDIDILVIAGGSGSVVYWDNKKMHEIINKVYQKPNTVISAICLSPVTLAKAGILKGKKATVWYSEKKRLESLGAIPQEEDVVIDGRIVTANGPKSALQFAKAIYSVYTQLNANNTNKTK